MVLIPLLQADETAENRPAVLLRELSPFGDFLASGISTQVHQTVPGFDEIIGPSDVDFAQSGLASELVIRLGFLAVLPRSRILGAIGSIDAGRHTRLLATLSAYLSEPIGRSPEG